MKICISLSHIHPSNFNIQTLHIFFMGEVWCNGQTCNEKNTQTISLLRPNQYKIEYYWIVTERYLPLSQLNGDWKATEILVSVLTVSEWLHFVMWYLSAVYYKN